MTTAQKTAPKGVTIIDRRGKDEIVYKPGDIGETAFWRLFEIYVMDFICNLLPDAKVELQRHFTNSSNKIIARVDGYIEMDGGKRRILIEIKHYKTKISSKTIEKIFRDQKLVKPTDYWLVISNTTPSLSRGVAESLYKKNIKIIRTEPGWENRVMELIGNTDDKPGDEKVEAPTGLQVEWIFDEDKE